MRKSFAVLFLLVLALPAQLLADTYMKQHTHTDAVVIFGQTQPAKDAVEDIWLKPGMVRINAGERGSLLRLDQKKLYNLNNSGKSYTEQTLSLSKALNDRGLTAQEKAIFANLAKTAVTVRDTGESKKIGKWNCRKYVQTAKTPAGPITTEIWATADLKADYAQFADWRAALQSLQPGLTDQYATAAQELRKVKGVPVLTVSTVKIMGVNARTVTELLDYRTGPAPTGTYELPLGYNRKNCNCAD